MSIQELEIAQSVNEYKSDRYRRYFRAKQTPRNTSIMAPPEFRQAYFTSVPFCRTACQVISERIEIDSVQTSDDKSTKVINDALKKWGGADFVNTAHMAAMEYGRAYLVPTGTDDPEFIGATIVPGRDMVHFIDPYTGEILEALRVFGKNRTKRVYYTPESTSVYEPAQGGWARVSSTPTPNGKIVVFPLICRDESGKPWGRPEAKDIFTNQDSACRVATDLAIASATLAVPLRAISGIEEDDFTVRNPDGTVAVDDNGDPIKQTGAELYMSRMLLLSDPGAKLAEFTSAQLQNFTTALNFLTKQAAATMGVPQSVFGVASDANPASGEALRQDDARLIRRAEQLTRGFERGWLPFFEYVLESLGLANEEVRILWVDPSLPNLASRADAIAKLAAITVSGRSLFNWEELRRKLGDGQDEIMAAEAQHEVDRLNGLLTEPPANEPQSQPPNTGPAVRPTAP